MVPSTICEGVEPSEITAKSKSVLLTLEGRLDKFEDILERLEGEVEILKAQNRMVIQRTTLSFADQFYFKGGVSLLIPRARTFPFTVDTGLGAFVGVGKYFHRNHVFDLGLEWDLYPSASLKYRYEIHLSSPLMNLGPIIGYKLRLANLRPFDNFLEQPLETQGSFYLVGAHLGFPMSRSVVGLEALYLFNSQAILVGNVAIHFFL